MSKEIFPDDSELKPLFARLNAFSTKALKNAAGLTLARTHYEISSEHFLRQLLMILDRM